MTMTYSRYIEMGGIISEREFNQLFERTRELLLDYAAEFVPHWLMKPTLEEMVDTEKLYLYQLDYIAQNGGVNVFNGQNDLDLKQVTTSGFSYSIASGDKVEFFNGVPISPLVKGNLKRQLSMNGYLYRGLA